MAQYQEQQRHFKTEPLLTMAERFEIESKIREHKYEEYDSVKKQVQAEAKQHDAEMRSKLSNAPVSRLQAGQVREAYRPDLRGVDTETARYRFDDDDNGGNGGKRSASDRKSDQEKSDQEKTPADREREQREQREKEQREQREKEEHEQRTRPTANAPPVVMRKPVTPVKPDVRRRR